MSFCSAPQTPLLCFEKGEERKGKERRVKVIWKDREKKDGDKKSKGM